MVGSIIAAVLAESARDAIEDATGGTVIYSPSRPLLRVDEPAEQARQRLTALDRFPWSRPAGHA